MRLTGKIIARGARPWSKTDETGKERSGTVHSLTVRDDDTEQPVDVSSFSLAIDADPRFPLDGPFAEAVVATGAFRGVARCRLVSDKS